jgi:hypothetical protein
MGEMGETVICTITPCDNKRIQEEEEEDDNHKYDSHIQINFQDVTASVKSMKTEPGTISILGKNRHLSGSFCNGMTQNHVSTWNDNCITLWS